jgi:iron(III) transport system substrate-binding protein
MPWGPVTEIEAAARREAKLVIYTGAGHASLAAQKAISAYMAQKNGVSVEWTTLSPNDVAPRVLIEHRTRQHVVDIGMYGFGGALYAEAKPRGLLAPILAPSSLEKNVWRLDPAVLTPEDRDWLFIQMGLMPGLFINTVLVPPGQEPLSYQDLLNPKWKGKIVLQTPAIGGSGYGWFTDVYKTLGLDYMKALARQVALIRNLNDVPDGVARGQYAIGIAPSQTRALELIKENAPVKFVYPKEGSVIFVIGTMLMAHSPHPNAAKTFLNWFYTKEGQTLFNVSNLSTSVRRDVSQDHLPPDLRYTEGQKFMLGMAEDFMPERAREIRDLARKIFEKRQ